MATRTPSPTTPEPTLPAVAPAERRTESATTARHVQRLLDSGAAPPTATTASRALPPPVVVRNKRLARGVGEAFLVWRCLDCGSVGSLDALPQRCDCDASREALSYVTED